MELFQEAIAEKKLNPADYTDHLDWLEQNQKQYFYREYLVFPRENLDEWLDELWDIQKNIREAQLKNQFYKNTWQCTIRGVCPFFDVCTAIDKDAVIEGSFVHKEAINEELVEASSPF